MSYGHLNFSPLQIQRFLDTFKEIVKELGDPLTERIIKDYGQDPFLILVSCLLSLRTRDTVTYPISKRLFARASTPQEMVMLPIPELTQLIHGVNFYPRKALTLHTVSRMILDTFHGKVPSTEEELLSLPGVGRKTANLVLSMAFNKPAICVDTHVHKIANELGLVSTIKPEETERELQKIIPKNRWSELNYLFVKCGQNRKKCSLEPLKRVLNS